MSTKTKMSFTKTLTTTALLATLAFTSQGCLGSKAGVNPVAEEPEEIAEVIPPKEDPYQSLWNEIEQAISSHDKYSGAKLIKKDPLVIDDLVAFDLEIEPDKQHGLGLYNRIDRSLYVATGRNGLGFYEGVWFDWGFEFGFKVPGYNIIVFAETLILTPRPGSNVCQLTLAFDLDKKEVIVGKWIPMSWLSAYIPETKEFIKKPECRNSYDSWEDYEILPHFIED